MSPRGGACWASPRWGRICRRRDVALMQRSAELTSRARNIAPISGAAQQTAEQYFRCSQRAVGQVEMRLHCATPMLLEKYSIGVGDRFARQAKAQLRAC